MNPYSTFDIQKSNLYNNFVKFMTKNQINTTLENDIKKKGR